MKKALHKDFRMEVRKSKSRFVSIFLIVSLGVAFYSGIQASDPGMRRSSDRLYDEQDLMDIKIVGTMGLTDKDVQALQALEEISLAEGAWSVDVLCGEEASVKVLHVESLNTFVNQPIVLEGRLPEKSGECFMDARCAQESGYKIGDVIRLKQDEEHELLLKEEFTIVGLGNSPMYISGGRGNSTVGSGEVSGFLYVCPEDFDQEIYTQIYLRVNGAEEKTVYTDGYDDLIEKVLEVVESQEELRCQVRYDDIVTEAQSEYDEAWEEYSQEKSDAEKELADAYQELMDGEQEILDAKAEIADGEKQLADAKIEIADGKKSLLKAELNLQMDGFRYQMRKKK